MSPGIIVLYFGTIVDIPLQVRQTPVDRFGTRNGAGRCNCCGETVFDSRLTAFCLSCCAILPYPVPHRGRLKVSQRIPCVFRKAISHNILRMLLYPSTPLGASPSAFRHRSLRHRAVQRNTALRSVRRFSTAKSGRCPFQGPICVLTSTFRQAHFGYADCSANTTLRSVNGYFQDRH